MQNLPNLVSSQKPFSFIDKLGFQFPSIYFNGERYRQYATGSVTIVRWGNWSQLLIHHEAMLSDEKMEQAVFRTIVSLAINGVFQMTLGAYFILLYRAVSEGTIPFSFAFEHMINYFVFNEMEVTMDFPGVAFLATAKNDFKQTHGTTFYTKDYHKKRRGEDSNRQFESKGVQKSFFKIYRKDLQLGLKDSPINRMEFTFSGKYAKHLNTSILSSKQEDVLFLMLPTIKSIMHKLTVPENLVFNPIALLYKGSPLAQLLKDLAWFPEGYRL